MRPWDVHIKFLSLFSGIGGFDKGLEDAGMECVGQVEIDPFCQKVLKKHWPNVKMIGDIHDVKGDEFGAVELICGGYPCQCDSTAGNMRGQEDDRWLWPEMLRIIKVNMPNWVIGENVINHENMGLKVVVSDLEAIGYQVRTFVIPNAACGLSTVERHVWVIAATTCERCKRGETYSHTNYRDEGQFQGTNQGELSRWNLPESRVCRSRKGVPNWMDRIKSLGNSIPPQIVQIIGSAIIEIERGL